VEKKEKISSKLRRGIIPLLYVISPDSNNCEFVFVQEEKVKEIT